MGKAGTYVGCNLPVHSSNYTHSEWTSLFDCLASNTLLEVMRQAKHLTFRIADRPGLLAEASALWQQGVHVEAFSAELHTAKETFHLVVDKAAVAKKTFIENGWEVAEEDAQQHRHQRTFGPH